MHAATSSNTSRWIAALAATLLLGGAGAQAQAPAPAPLPEVERSDKAKPAEKATPAKPAQDTLEARLEAAQQRLEQAASEVGELSAQLGENMAHRFAFVNEDRRRAIIGVQLDPASGKEGARVREVSPGGPAAEAGVRAGDVIVAVNGKEVKGESTREVVRLMRDVEPESKVKLRVMREGKPKELEVTARRMSRQFRFNTAPGFEVPEPPEPPQAPEPFMGFDFGNWRGGLHGIEMTTLTPGLGRYFGTDKGVLVVRAPEQSTYKLQEGDVILSIDGREPTNSSHAMRILRSYQPGEKLNMRLMRDRKALNLEVTLPQPQRPERRVIFRRGPEQEA
jgi:S1-C subfamily serine protease